MTSGPTGGHRVGPGSGRRSGHPSPDAARIGFYVHHHGTGHLRRTAAVLDRLDRPATVLTSLDVEPGVLGDAVEVVPLPPDHHPDGPPPPDPTAGGALHWAPLDPRRLQPRAAVLTSWLTSGRAAALVCDVSVEAALLARLCGVAPIVVRQHGNRIDGPHELAHRAAVALLAPYPQALEPLDTPAWIRSRTHHAGMLTAAHAPLGRLAARRSLGLADRPTLVIAVGGGGDSLPAPAVAAAADELDGWNVVAVGSPTTGSGEGWRCDGWVSDIWPHLRAADVVAGAGGANLVAEVAAADRPLICVAEERPFDEQVVRARRLAELGAAVVPPHWPRPGQWRSVVEAALALGSSRLAALVDLQSPDRAAAWIAAVSDAPVSALHRTGRSDAEAPPAAGSSGREAVEPTGGRELDPTTADPVPRRELAARQVGQ